MNEKIMIILPSICLCSWATADRQQRPSKPSPDHFLTFNQQQKNGGRRKWPKLSHDFWGLVQPLWLGNGGQDGWYEFATKKTGSFTLGQHRSWTSWARPQELHIHSQICMVSKPYYTPCHCFHNISVTGKCNKCNNYLQCG